MGGGNVWGWWFTYITYATSSGVKTEGCGGYLTTPVGYITSIPVDPFTSKGSNWVMRNAGWDKILEAGFFYGCRWRPPMAIDSIFIKTQDAGAYLQSTGPDLLIDGFYENPGSNYPYWNPYDPTNGTVSIGDIYWFAKGLGFISGP